MNLYALQATVTPAYATTGVTSTLATCQAGTLMQATRKLRRAMGARSIANTLQLKQDENATTMVVYVGPVEPNN